MFGLFVEHGPYVVYKNMTGKKRFGSTAHAGELVGTFSLFPDCVFCSWIKELRVDL